MDIIFEKIAIIDLLKQEAKIQEFKEGINVVSSDVNGTGNYVGKSTILKSLYHTLGADSLFEKSKGWEETNDYIYILNFRLDDVRYSVLRKGNYFKIVNDGKILLETNNRKELSAFLSKLYNFKIFLKENNESKKYVLSQPFAYYVLDFIDQKNYRGCLFSSFNNMGEFYNVKDDLIYSHLGLDVQQLETLISEQYKNESELKQIDDELSFLKRAANEIREDNSEISFEPIEAMQNEMKQYKENYEEKLSSYNSLKQAIYDLNIQKSKLESVIREIAPANLKTLKNNGKTLNNHTCPLCQNEIDNYVEVFFKVAYVSDNLDYQRIQYQERLSSLEKELNDKIAEYQIMKKEIDEIENVVFSKNNDIKKAIESVGLRDYKSKLLNKLGELEIRKSVLEENNRVIKKNIAKLKRSISSKNNEYNSILVNLINTYQINLIRTDREYKLTEKIPCSDSHVLSVLWLVALNKLKSNNRNRRIMFPLVFDNPTDRDFDDKNKQMIFRMIFDTLSFKKQIIVSVVKYNDFFKNEYDINHIKIVGKQFHLLNKEEYELAYNMFSEVQSAN